MTMLRVILACTLCLIALPPAATASHIGPWGENDPQWKDLRLRGQVHVVQQRGGVDKKRRGAVRVTAQVRVQRTDRTSTWRFATGEGRKVFRGYGKAITATGRQVIAVETSNTTVAWAEWRSISRGRYRIDVRSQRLLPTRGPRVLVATKINKGRTAWDQFPLVIGVTDNGQVAVQFGGGPIMLGKTRGKLRTFAKAGSGARLTGIFDGQTLWWERPEAEPRYRSLLAPPMIGKCPLLKGFSVLAEPEGYLLTNRFVYGVGEVETSCRRVDGRVSILPNGYLAGYSGTVVLMSYDYSDRDDSNYGGAFTYDLASQKKLRTVWLADSRLFGVTSIAVTSAGRAAWVDGTHLVAMPAEDGKPRIVLDEAVITDLRADGERFTWVANGVPKSEPAP